jgi:O-glycosyl hydrolase
LRLGHGRQPAKLSRFSVQHDVPYIIPELQQALSINPAIKITATPWSPPGWMKTSGSMIGGTLKPEYSAALANYFLKYVQAYRKAGVPISYITPQNEPLNAPTWPGMAMTAYTESRLVQQIGKAFADNYIPTKILGWDHNWDVPSYPETIFNDPAASGYAVGTGWHIYSGSPIYQTLAHNDYPGKESYLTEATGGTWQASTQVAFHDALDAWILGGTRNWANGVMLWNIALDPDMGPLNRDTNGIGVCRGLVTIDPKTGQVTYNADYYALAQESKFVRPGARRIYSNTFGEGGVEDVAFQNADGSKVLVGYNSGNAASTFSVADGAQSFDYTLPAGNAVTFTYSGPREGGGTPAATNVTDPTHDFTFESPSGPATVTYDPALLPIQDGVRSGNSLMTYSLPAGASLRTSAPALNRSGWTVTASSNASGDVAAKALDGDPGSRWRTGIKAKSGDWFQLNLGRPTSFSQIVLDNTEDNSFDSVAKYQVYVSNDGVTWGSAVANGSGDIKKVTITMPPQTAQYVRIVSTAPSFFFHWSIGEITLYGSSGAAGAMAAPRHVPDGLRLQSWTSPDGTGVTVVYNRTGSKRSFPISADGSYIYTLPGGTSAMFTTQDLSSFPTPALNTLTPNQAGRATSSRSAARTSARRRAWARSTSGRPMPGSTPGPTRASAPMSRTGSPPGRTPSP